MATCGRNTRGSEEYDPKLLAKFKPLRPSEAERQEPQQWLIEGWLPGDALVELYAKPETGKTLLALDWAMSIAAGVAWLGHAVRSCKALYLYIENPRGRPQRMAAWYAERGEHLRPLVEENLRFVSVPVNLRDTMERKCFIQAQWAEFQPDLIVIDTVNKCFGAGDENATRDMTEFVAACDDLRQAFPGATVLVLHHPGKNESRGDRGSTVLHCALDMQLHLTQRGDNSGKLTLTTTKLRDGARHEPLALQRVAMGESCVIRAAGAGGAVKAKGAKAKPVDRTLAVLAGLGAEGATEEEWRAAAEASGCSKSKYYRDRSALIEAERVALGEDGRFRVVASEPSPALPAAPVPLKREVQEPPLPAVASLAPSVPQAKPVVPKPELTEAEDVAIFNLALFGDRGATPREWRDAGGPAKVINEMIHHRPRPDLVFHNEMTDRCYATEAVRAAFREDIKNDWVLARLRDCALTSDEWIKDACEVVIGSFEGDAAMVRELIAELVEDGRVVKMGNRYRCSERKAA